MSVIGLKCGKLFASFSNLTVRFASDNRGAVTIDYVILTSGVIVAAIAIFSIIGDMRNIPQPPHVLHVSSEGHAVMTFLPGTTGKAIPMLVGKLRMYFNFKSACMMGPEAFARQYQTEGVKSCEFKAF